MEVIQISDNDRYAMGQDDRPYRSDWEPSYADYYLVDLETGARAPVLENHLRTLGFSPDGKHYLYWKDQDVWSYRTGTGEHVNLTDGFPVPWKTRSTTISAKSRPMASTASPTTPRASSFGTGTIYTSNPWTVGHPTNLTLGGSRGGDRVPHSEPGSRRGTRSTFLNL